MNKVILIGRLVRDPELKYTANGTAVCQTSIAVERRFKADNQPTADFIPIVAWRQNAEFICKYFSKGNRIALSGALQTRSWEDNDGNKRYATEVIADSVEFAESKSSAQTAQTEAESKALDAAPQEARKNFIDNNGEYFSGGNDVDIPF